MKEKLIQLAKDKGFTSQLLCNTPYKHFDKEEIRWKLWKYELIIWLGSKIDLVVNVDEQELRDTLNFM